MSPHPSTGLVSFAGGSSTWRRAGRRFRTEAEKSGYFGAIDVLDEGDLLARFPHFQHDRRALFRSQSRGFGFWSWKPLIILDFLSSNPHVDRVLYLDAGSHFNVSKGAKRRFQEYEEMVESSGYLFFHRPELPECNWTKLEVLEHLKLTEEMRHSGQVIGGAHFWSRSDRSSVLLAKWDELMRFEGGRLVADPPKDAPHATYFREHRHDQSILSCLTKSLQISAEQDETDFYPDFRLGSQFPLWTVRNNTRFRFFQSSNLRRASSFVDFHLSKFQDRA